MKSFVPLLLVLALASCSTNPVTGEKEFMLVSESEELKMGAESYLPLRQSSGGDYVADQALVDYVAEVGRRVARVSDRDLPYEFEVVNDAGINAWALPGGKIAINRGLLLELDNEAELAAVLGHEVVHAAARHGAQSLSRGTAINLATQLIAFQAADSDYPELIGSGAAIAGAMVGLKYGRDAELESDRYGMIYMRRAGYDPMGAVTLQEKFVRLSQSKRSGWFEKLFASHPPSQDRVDANRRFVKKLKPGGELGEERYRRATAHLVSVREAYAAHAKGRAALAKGRLDEAERLARSAIRIEPGENQFHLLLGDVLTRQGKNRQAKRSYDVAAKIAPEYYAAYEKRGLLNQKLGDQKAYRQDMESAAALLPTAVSFLSLGQLSENAGDPQRAIGYLKAAAESNSTSGKQAAREFDRLDRLHNPHNYLRASISRDAGQLLVVAIDNPLANAVRDVDFVIEYGNPLFPKTAKRYVYDKTIGRKARITLNTDIGPVSDKRFKERRYRVRFIAAKTRL